MSADLKTAILHRSLELSLAPAWLNLLKPLDRKKFPDSETIESLITKDNNNQVFKNFRMELRNMGLWDDVEVLTIYQSLFHLWEMEIGGKPVTDKPITIGDVRHLNVFELSRIDGLDKKGSFGVEIVSKLFR